MENYLKFSINKKLDIAEYKNNFYIQLQDLSNFYESKGIFLDPDNEVKEISETCFRGKELLELSKKFEIENTHFFNKDYANLCEEANTDFNHLYLPLLEAKEDLSSKNFKNISELLHFKCYKNSIKILLEEANENFDKFIEEKVSPIANFDKIKNDEKSVQEQNTFFILIEKLIKNDIDKASLILLIQFFTKDWMIADSYLSEYYTQSLSQYNRNIFIKAFFQALINLAKSYQLYDELKLFNQARFLFNRQPKEENHDK
ncbi:hypothetical protein A6A19_00245 [Actinobacillus delphinicola]|uniref:hypothetical protein n=1 Tax=Actinobacillus delphinicola TaxID=51161 RepID=UPI0024417240|nr:hypothetical protein [Actinobacillus delphinicola]MDG6896475.1 hypothetical protein [Actinobacillus delphinicola]